MPDYLKQGIVGKVMVPIMLPEISFSPTKHARFLDDFQEFLKENLQVLCNSHKINQGSFRRALLFYFFVSDGSQ